MAQSSWASHPFVTWSLVLAGSASCSSCTAGAGKGLSHLRLSWHEEKNCFAPPTLPLLLPECKATPRSSHWQPLWECVFCVIVSTKIAAQLEDSPSPSPPLQRSSSKTGAELPIGIWPEDGKTWGDIFHLHRRGLLESQTLSF